MRNGKLVDENDPVYLLDKNVGTCRVPLLNGGFLQFENLKFINRDAFDANYTQIRIGGKKYRVQKDELEMALKYV